ncbi:MAG: hypothetical protein RL141_868 [Candidatus Parcubacteria bacterium]|jgi:glutamyl-tRNA synthetase
MTLPVRVRSAISPTGFLHIGNLRTVLYNEFFARSQGGTFILRIEDTDQSRYVEGADKSLLKAFSACGITVDEGVVMKPNGEVGESGEFGPYIQSKRKETHRAYADNLVEMGKAYPCFCSEKDLVRMREEQQAAGLPPGYNRTCRSLSPEQAKKRIANGDEYVIRLAVPLKGNVSFNDIIRGEVRFDWQQVDDQVIIKGDGLPTYHLAATCDDHDMQISHVIRGEEWLTSTPKHLFIYEAFGWTPPQYAHLPLLLNADRSKLSKRQGDVAVEDYLAKGILPDALVNFVALLGWNPTGDREIYTRQELRTLFKLDKVNKGGAVVNFEKLDWMNGQYIINLPKETYLDKAGEQLRELTDDSNLMDRMALLVRDRLVRFTELPELVGSYLKPTIDVDPAIIPWKKSTPAEAAERLTAVLSLLQGLPEPSWASVEALEAPIKQLIATNAWGNGDTLWPLRVALSGQEKSPGPFELLWALGKERSMERLEKAIQKVNFK